MSKPVDNKHAGAAGSTGDSKAFVDRLVAEMDQLFAGLGELETLEAESEGKVEVATLLQLALKSELEASELAAFWLPSTPDLDAKRLLADQCSDEMKHYHLISNRLRELGFDVDSFDPLADEGYSPLYHYLKGLRGTVERVAGGPFAREAIARVRNRQFINFCLAVGDRETAELYELSIHPEEIHHHNWARRYLEQHCATPEAQEQAATAARTTLAIADELRTLKEKTTGLLAIPVS